MIPATDLIGFIRELLMLQGELVAAFRNAYPNLRDWRFLIDFPSSGVISMDGANWSFRKHGAGLTFVSSLGVVVDFHRALGKSDVFDAWRLLQYVESVVPKGDVSETEAELDAVLENLSGSGQLIRTDIRGEFRLK